MARRPILPLPCALRRPLETTGINVTKIVVPVLENELGCCCSGFGRWEPWLWDEISKSTNHGLPARLLKQPLPTVTISFPELALPLSNGTTNRDGTIIIILSTYQGDSGTRLRTWKVWAIFKMTTFVTTTRIYFVFAFLFNFNLSIPLSPNLHKKTTLKDSGSCSKMTSSAIVLFCSRAGAHQGSCRVLSLLVPDPWRWPKRSQLWELTLFFQQESSVRIQNGKWREL